MAYPLEAFVRIQPYCYQWTQEMIMDYPVMTCTKHPMGYWKRFAVMRLLEKDHNYPMQ